MITMRHVILVKDAWVLLSTCRYIFEHNHLQNTMFTLLRIFNRNKTILVVFNVYSWFEDTNEVIRIRKDTDI
jgi:hypothetical protein